MKKQTSTAANPVLLVFMFLLTFLLAFYNFYENDNDVLAESSTNDWPQFRGLARDGRSSETGIVKNWSKDGPKVVWRKEINDGYAGIAIQSDRLYTSYSSGDHEVLFCLDALNGDEIWRFQLNKNFTEQYGDGPRSTPTVDAERVYAMGSYGLLYALDKNSGQKIWQVDIHKEFGDPDGDYSRGYSCSPLIDGDLLIVNGGRQPTATIVALNKKTGATVWTYINGGNSFSSQDVKEISGTRQLISSIEFGVVGLSPDTGEELWRFPWDTKYGLNIAMPLFLPPNEIFISSGYGKGSALFRILKAGSGWKVEQVWENRLFRNHFTASVVHQKYVYGFDNNMLACIDSKTGEELWKVRGYGKGSLISIDDFLVVLGEKGALALVEATPKEFRELARTQIFDSKCWTPPAFAHGRLYLRNQQELVCLNLMKE